MDDDGHWIEWNAFLVNILDVNANVIGKMNASIGSSAMVILMRITEDLHCNRRLDLVAMRLIIDDVSAISTSEKSR